MFFLQNKGEEMEFFEEEIADHIVYVMGCKLSDAHAMIMANSFIFIQGWIMGESVYSVANRILKEKKR